MISAIASDGSIIDRLHMEVLQDSAAEKTDELNEELWNFQKTKENRVEYYILKVYQKRKKEYFETKRTLNESEQGENKVVKACVWVIFISCIEMLVTSFIWPKENWYLGGYFAALLAFCGILYGNFTYQKKYIYKNLNSQKEKILILDRILVDELGIKTKKKLLEFIDIYEEYVKKKKKEEKRRNKVISMVFMLAASGASISFQNLDVIGIEFSIWLQILSKLLIFGAVTGIGMYAISLLSLVEAYEKMIKDLKELLLMKY